MQRPGGQPPAASDELSILSVEIRSGLIRPAETGLTVCGVERLFLTRLPRYTLAFETFRNSTHVLS